MKQLQKQIITYLEQGRLAQLATARDNRPWVCTVYYVVDEHLDIYWLSYPTRRHSQDIAANGRVALTVAIKPDVPVIGVQMEGVAREVEDVATIARVMKLYVQKYGVGRSFLSRFELGANKHRLYRLRSERIVLFDEVNFGSDNPQELQLSVDPPISWHRSW